MTARQGNDGKLMGLPAAKWSLKNDFAPLCTRAQRAVPAAVIASSMIEIESQGFPSKYPCYAM